MDCGQEDEGKRFDIGQAVAEIYEVLREDGGRLLARFGHRWAAATSLIHRAYRNVVEKGHGECRDAAHARRKMVRAMRCCLMDVIRRDRRYIVLNDRCLVPARPRREITAVNEGLVDLNEIDAIKAEIVERWYFGGFTLGEIAHDMRMSLSTVKREFREAKCWLHKYLND